MTSCTHDVRSAGWHRGGASHLFLPWLFHPPKPMKANRTGMHRVRFRLNIPIFLICQRAFLVKDAKRLVCLKMQSGRARGETSLERTVMIKTGISD